MQIYINVYNNVVPHSHDRRLFKKFDKVFMFNQSFRSSEEASQMNDMGKRILGSRTISYLKRTNPSELEKFKSKDMAQLFNNMLM